MANPNRLANLKNFPPGVSGNPKGYSKGRRVSDAIAKLMEDRELGPTVAAILFAAATDDQKILKGRKPNAQFMAMLLERYEGKVAIPLHVTEFADDPDSPFSPERLARLTADELDALTAITAKLDAPPEHEPEPGSEHEPDAGAAGGEGPPEPDGVRPPGVERP